MNIFRQASIAIVIISWTTLIIVWGVSAFTAKRTAKSAGQLWPYRLGVAVVMYLIIRYGGFAHTIIYPLSTDPIVDMTGAVLVVLGMALCIWARMHLGRNWGMPMSEKKSAELVTSGPYALIRNPIYSGVLLAMLGTALTASALWLLILVVGGSYFIWSALIEEKIMMRLFPNTYPAYKARTWRIIPWVW